MNSNENTLHAHVETASADCDGPMHRSYTVFQAEGGEDTMDFMNNTFAGQVSPYAVSIGMKVTITEDGFEWNESTEEGYRSGEVRWCHEPDCEPRSSQRDVYAEMMGY